ncbi:MAG: hypothetical protein AAGN46_17995 [Acidobacteriota bacterium]
MSSIDDATFAARARDLEWLLLDVDGVLTDGVLVYGAEGEVLKRFHVRDGLALRLAQRAGLRLAALSGRNCAPLETRLIELDFAHVHLGSKDKRADFAAFLEKQATTAERVAAIGDDLQDLVVLTRTGLSFAPIDAVPEVRERVDVVLERRGGEACVREMVERLLRARGEWSRLIAPYLEA